jgi:hypothetical protein
MMRPRAMIGLTATWTLLAGCSTPEPACGGDSCASSSSSFSSSTVSSTSFASTTATSSGASSGAGGAGGAPSASASGSSDSSSSGTPTAVYCGNPKDCASGETCAPDGICKAGDCNANGCIYGFPCDAGTGTCVRAEPNGCGDRADCTPLGVEYACSGAHCTAPADLCTDASQCSAPGDHCVEGICTLSCTSNSDCRDGFGCDTTLGVCTKVSKSCTITNDCGGPQTVCVASACVPRSARGVCSNPGDIWVNNGCIPAQKPAFVCASEGQEDVCALGSICLHHSCYISCDAPNPNACSAQTVTNVCKPVTTASGTHNVCGTNQNLGNQCDPTANLPCQSGVCVDGFCK